MKIWPLLLLVAAGALYFVVRDSSDVASSYTPLTEQQVQDHSEAPTTIGRAARDGEEIRRISVDGMCCAGCAGKLYKALVAVPGVKLAAVDFDAGIASALVEAGTEGTALVQALTTDDKYAAALVE